MKALFYVITYDIPCDRRRQKVAHLLQGYGRRVQWSVFECVLTAAQYAELRRRLRTCIHPTEDSLRCYPLSGHTLPQVEVWGEPSITQVPGSTII